MENYTSISEVDRISAMSDPVIRNLQITQSYYELSSALSKRTGPCANWCTFGTWASKQAGRTIRKEDLTLALEDRLKKIPEISQAVSDIAEYALRRGARMNMKGIVKLVWETLDPNAAMERAGAAVGRGNQKVYAEIAREFARFLDTCLDDSAYDADSIAGFCALLKPGDPPDGQRYLRQAFSRYYQAVFEPDQKARAEHILLANLEIGYHEQIRLQPEIAEALEASVEDPKVFKRRLINTLLPARSWILDLGALFTALTGRPTPLDKAINRFSAVARHRIRLFLTERFMELGFPKGVRLRLGHDLTERFPAVLANLNNADLLALLQQIDPTPDSVKETGAIDWADFPDRLHYIADLFRCHHETPDLLTPPFEQEQVMAIKAGRLPSGKL